MKHVAILCPGPSLARLAVPVPVDVTIGVNRAAVRFACDWAVVLDSPALAEFGGSLAGNPLLLTRRDYRPKYTTRPGLAVEHVPFPAVPHYGQFSVTAALVLAVAHLGAAHVTVYGADQTDAPDFDGHVPLGANRGEERWERERAIWQDLVNAMPGVAIGKGA